jgi:hypothetical protein
MAFSPLPQAPPQTVYTAPPAQPPVFSSQPAQPVYVQSPYNPPTQQDHAMAAAYRAATNETHGCQSDSQVGCGALPPSMVFPD